MSDETASLSALEDDLQRKDERPPAPPTPPPLPSHLQQDLKVSKFALKARAAPPGWYFDGWATNPPPNPSDPPTGPYFFYGTLMDAEMLRDVLGTKETPQTRLAKVVGYSCKAWGQYPALVDGVMDQVVSGRAWELSNVDHAKRLIEYETNNYTIKAARIFYSDFLSPRNELGWTFKFSGRESELSDDKFGLDIWLRRMGRTLHNTSIAEGNLSKQ